MQSLDDSKQNFKMQNDIQVNGTRQNDTQ